MAFSSYSVDNDRIFRNALQRAEATTQDLRVPFGQILSDFYRSEKAIFNLSGPGQYPPFKHSDAVFQVAKRSGRRTFQGTVAGSESPYQYRKIKKYGFDYPLLKASGQLAGSVLGPSNPGSISIIGNLSLIFGTSIKYGIYHQSDAPRSKIPLRKFLFIGPEAAQFATSDQMGRLTRWNNILNDYTLKKLKQSGAFQS